MLSKNKRLNLSTDFEWIKSGTVIQTPHFKLFSKFGDNQLARVGVAIVSKQFPKAVQRNRAKRIIFSAFEKIYETLPQNLNIIALPNKGIDKVKSEDLILEIKKALGKNT